MTNSTWHSLWLGRINH